MPAIDQEIEEALKEDVKIKYLAAPTEVFRDASGKIVRLAVQCMELGEPDDSGRRRPIPIEGTVDEIEADTVILAVSQEPDWSMLGSIQAEGSYLNADSWGRTNFEGVWAGGDALGLGLATISIGQGRKAAESIHTHLRGEVPSDSAPKPAIGADHIKLDWYPDKERTERGTLPLEERLARPTEEVDLGITKVAAIEETARCLSCGLCFGCENCWMYCQNSCFKKRADADSGDYYDLDLTLCDGCKKCGEECPCGYIDLI
jgi:NADPH-dependent glutamate synthase beta subunit-like oxidoreductase